MKKVTTKIMSFYLALISVGALAPINIYGFGTSLLGTGIYCGSHRHQFSVHHRSLGTLSVQSSSNTPRSSTLTLYKGTTRIGTVSYIPAHYLTNPILAKSFGIEPDQLAVFKRKAHGNLDNYAYIYWVYIDPQYRGQKLTTLLFWCVHQELITRNYKGLCLEAKPFEYGKLWLTHAKNPEEHKKQLHDRVQVYTHLGLTPLPETNNSAKSVLFMQHQLNTLSLPEGISLSTTPLENAARLLQIWDHYRGPISLGVIVGALVLHRALR